MRGAGVHGLGQEHRWGTAKVQPLLGRQTAGRISITVDRGTTEFPLPKQRVGQRDTCEQQ